VIVRKENEDHILDTNNNSKWPEDKAHYSKDVSPGKGDGMMPVGKLPDCVEWAGPYVTIDNTNSTEGEDKSLVLELALRGFCLMGGNGAAIARVVRSVQETPAKSLKV
jgi:hypothetical protein